jgi:hypothetical protein
MKNIALIMSAFALLAFSGIARADDTATTQTEKTTKAGGKKTTKSTKTETNADGTGSTETKTKTEKTAK